MKCSECNFWLTVPDYPGWGECRKHAPSPYILKADSNVGPYNSRAVWPYTRYQDGCSEGQNKGAKVEINAANQDVGPIYPKTFDAEVKAAYGKVRR